MIFGEKIELKVYVINQNDSVSDIQTPSCSYMISLVL
jgi:hypothetical protein